MNGSNFLKNNWKLIAIVIVIAFLMPSIVKILKSIGKLGGLVSDVISAPADLVAWVGDQATVELAPFIRNRLAKIVSTYAYEKGDVFSENVMKTLKGLNAESPKDFSNIWVGSMIAIFKSTTGKKGYLSKIGGIQFGNLPELLKGKFK